MREQQPAQVDGGKGKSRPAYLWFNPVLRFLQLFASVCAFSVAFHAGVNGYGYSSFHALRFLVGATIITAAWALLMMLLDCLALGRGQGGIGKTSTILRIVFDYVAAGLALSAGSAAAGITTFNDQGGFPYAQTICEGDTPWNSFCARSKAATAMTFLVFFFFLPSLFAEIGSLLYLEESSDNK